MLLCLDIAFDNIGWSAFQGGKPIDVGLIHAEKSGKKTVRVADERADRCASMTGDLLSVIMRHKVDGIIGELPTGSQNAAAANLCGWASGLVVSICRVLDLPAEWVSPNDVKMAVIGRRDASKMEIMDMVSNHYGWQKDVKIINIAKGKRAGKESVQNVFHCLGKKFPAGTFEHVADSIGVYWSSKNRNLVRQYG
jgi:Holliday junction resolvasome RuvABC endonuclease subunit